VAYLKFDHRGNDGRVDLNYVNIYDYTVIQYNYIDDCRKSIEFNAGDLDLLHRSRDERISTASIYSLVYAASSFEIIFSSGFQPIREFFGPL